MRSFSKFLINSLVICLLFSSCQKDVVDNVLSSPPIANAGPSQTIQLPSSSITLTGTGTSTNGIISGYLWSIISGPNLPIIATPAASSTIISNVVSGTYLFQFMVIDEAGLTGVDTVSLFVTSSPVQTLTLQPAYNPNDVHLAFMNGGNGTDPGAIEFSGGAWTNGGSPLITRGIFKFDMSTIPAGATILSAKLTLYSNPTPRNGNLVDANSGTANSLFLERVTSSWDPSTVTWANQPGTDAASQLSIPHTSLTFFDLVDIDVTSMVGVMASTNNYGFKLRLQNEVAYNIRIFASSRHPDVTKHPKLVITYQ